MECRYLGKKILISIQKLWGRNENEIIKSIVDTEQNNKSMEEQNEQTEKAYLIMRVPLSIGIIYCLIGSLLLLWEKQESLFAIGIELIILGIYALLFSLIFFCEKAKHKESKLVKGLRTLLVFLMLPYHVCIKKIKKLIKDSRQEHVIYLFPYYFLSIFFVVLSFAMIVTFLPMEYMNDAYRGIKSFLIVLFLIFEFFGLGKVFAYLTTKQTIRAVQKAEIKKRSKVNWKGTFNDKLYKQERHDKFVNEWNLVKKELEYTKIYFYIILTMLVLWIPKPEDLIIEQYVNAFLGITTIAALAREAKAKKEDEEGITLSD